MPAGRRPKSSCFFRSHILHCSNFKLNLAYSPVRWSPVQDTPNKIQDLRSRIDSIDDGILDLLNERSRVVLEVGRLKSGNNLDFHVPGRERQIYERLLGQNPGPFPNDALKSIY
ncbi:MAG: chorismate mutase, partial [Deltaproteobacteria bacterium]|nr:chorismate mutase [Deltaproteobacteria bacterium]